MLNMNKYDFEQIFYNLLKGGLNIQQFEKWVYETDEVMMTSILGEVSTLS